MAIAHPFFLLLLLSFHAEAASVFNQSVGRAYAETIRLRIPDGRKLIRLELQSNPTNAVALLVENQQDFLTWCVQQDPKHYEVNLKAQENRLLKLTALKEQSVWVDYSIAEVRMHIALSKLLYGNKLAAAWDLRQAYLQYQSNAKRYPAFLPNKKTLGALQVLIGSVPDSYRFFLNIIGMKGNVPTGMANLQAAATKQNPFQQEALVLQALLTQLLDPEKGEEASASIQKLATGDPANLLYSFVAIHMHKKNKQSEKALLAFERRPRGKGYLSFPYLHHMAADLYLYKSDFERSIEENKTFLQQHQGEHYIKSSHFKLYLANWLNQDMQQAAYYFKRISNVGKTVVEEDAYADRFANQDLNTDRHLLLARLQSDGGYYKEALATMNQMHISSNTKQEVKAEYYYRKARIYHGLDSLSLAKQYYEQTIVACENSTLYYAPNAALQLGYLYQHENNPAKAGAYFRKAISYKNHEYKNSIDAKAKLALLTL